MTSILGDCHTSTMSSFMPYSNTLEYTISFDWLSYPPFSYFLSCFAVLQSHQPILVHQTSTTCPNPIILSNLISFVIKPQHISSSLFTSLTIHLIGLRRFINDLLETGWYSPTMFHPSTARTGTSGRHLRGPFAVLLGLPCSGI